MPLVCTHAEEGPWNPGLQSSLPAQYRPLASLFRTENVRNDLRGLLELSDYCGLPPRSLVEFRAQRLVAHEVLIRVTADVEVPDGPKYEDLGITFRAMVRALIERHLRSQIASCEHTLADIKQRAIRRIVGLLPGSSVRPIASPTARGDGMLSLLVRRWRPPPAPPAICVEEDDLALLASWQNTAEIGTDAFDRACLQALIAVATAVMAKHGRLQREPDLIAEIAARTVCNDYGSIVIGDAIELHFRAGVEAEGYRLLPSQARPYVMNIKGASASGKSTMRPLQRALAERLGVPWSDFSLISPDIWRKYLIDYDQLGEAFKYAGTLSAQELEIVDRKLDRYIAQKAAQGRLTHLLIDRFRFDSFVPDADAEVSSKLLTRFGSHIFLQFMITPPEATVERAWERGKKVGRYKAVDDLLAHNIEAYSGMPELFFTWALSRNKQVHYEFLANDVPYGARPRTVAFGMNGELNILDIGGMLDVERFRRINVEATDSQGVYAMSSQDIAQNIDFVRRCISLLPIVNFVEPQTGTIYARFEKGSLKYLAEEEAGPASGAYCPRQVLALLCGHIDRTKLSIAPPPRVTTYAAYTIGDCGQLASASAQDVRPTSTPIPDA